MNSTTPKRTRSPLVSNRTRSTPTALRTPGDRFIPTRSSDMSASKFNFSQEMANAAAMASGSVLSSSNTAAAVSEQQQQQAYLSDLTPAHEDYCSALRESMFDNDNEGKILAFKNKAPEGRNGNHNPHRVLFSAASSRREVESDKRRRAIPSAPIRVLDAPQIADDYYLNVLDWGANNVLAVALAQSVYLWNADTGATNPLLTTVDAANYAASVKWMPDASHLAIGLATGNVEIWDPIECRKVRTMTGHSARACSLSWNPAMPHLLSSGSMDTRILHYDVRQREPVISTSAAHSLEVCGLEWSPDGSQLASGGNDNLLCIWNANELNSPAHRIQHHQAAVKALGWAPHRSGLLASGGGTADRRLCFWNSHTGACIKEVDTKSQVCAIKWSKNHKDELITSHGFSNNQLTIWNYQRLNKLAELSGHTSRVLYMAESPDGETIVSAAGDESLRFWKAFAKTDASSSSSSAAAAAAAKAAACPSSVGAQSFSMAKLR